MSEKYLQTYIKGKYCVSTIYRESSVSIPNPPWYYETFVWDLDPDTGKFTTLTDETDEMKKMPDHHFRVVEKYMGGQALTQQGEDD